MCAFYRYLLKYVTDHAPQDYKELLQRKITRGIKKAPHARSLPPSLLEWRSTRQKSNMALPLTLADTTVSTVHVDSWTTCEEVRYLPNGQLKTVNTIDILGCLVSDWFDGHTPRGLECSFGRCWCCHRMQWAGLRHRFGV